MKYLLLGLGALVSSAAICSAITTYEAAGSNAAAITATRDAFRTAVGGGNVAGANGDFGGVRREINWDGVPATFSDPNLLPGDFFNVNSTRGVVLSTPGTGLAVSANAGLSNPPLFGFPGDLQTFSSQKLFTAVNSNIVDVTFFLPGTTTVATTTAFGLVFVDVEVAGSTKLEFFDQWDNLLYSHTALVGDNQGLSFLGAITGTDELISRVRITSGLNTFVSDSQWGNPYDDFVAMDDFIYAAPQVSTVVSNTPDAGSGAALLGLGLAALAAMRRRVVTLKS